MDRSYSHIKIQALLLQLFLNTLALCRIRRDDSNAFGPRFRDTCQHVLCSAHGYLDMVGILARALFWSLGLRQDAITGIADYDGVIGKGTKLRTRSTGIAIQECPLVDRSSHQVANVG